ncbi:hydroxyethylthiazole kinase [Treponema primitia]|uniref:hydroxyethylthiazole kinase n=1 Tax=Treponema primitia TaxID=88058 RepID=UPI003980E70B
MPDFQNATKTVRWPDAETLNFLRELREKSPLTHYITNQVVANFTANVLLAIGASPAMIIAVEEAGEFARIAQALLINVGTITNHDAEAMLKAAAAAHEAKTPWVLDPVAAGALEYRTRISSELIGYKPSIIRGNASEILAISGAIGGAKGVDSTASSAAAIAAARKLAVDTKAVVAVSGEVDYITDGETLVAVPGGHIIMTKITGTGCTLGAVMASFLPITNDPVKAATAASVIYAAAGELAQKNSKGTGSFAVAFVDALNLLGTE